MANSERFIEGYAKCLDNIEQVVDREIKRNNGARTVEGTINAFNAIVAELHRQKLEVQRLVEENEQSRVEPGIVFVAIKSEKL